MGCVEMDAIFGGCCGFGFELRWNAGEGKRRVREVVIEGALLLL